ncbi:MAG: Gfo/Idh/MocA family oxidoreductase [Lachnospiraceae bacterium]|jgi:predicted dehydrogenase|nr:Gfo/Idh/MocA family oxidoreductase [Lachnospiraceae bacterium]
MKVVGVVGCGAISDIYFTNMIGRFGNLQVTSCASKGMASARKKAELYGLKPVTMEEMFDDPQIDIIVNLTPPSEHYRIIKAALEHGKHVYTEKVITPDFRQAQELAALADRKQRLLCSAPDAFLGAAIQTVKKAVMDGTIGMVSTVNVALNRDIELLAELFRFTIAPGAGVGYDMGIYYLTALLSILGPVREVAGRVRTNRPTRQFTDPANPDSGKSYTIENENVMTGLLDFVGGTQGTVCLNTDSIFPSDSVMTLYGTKGILYVTDPNEFGGTVRLRRSMAEETEELAVEFDYTDNARGLGVAEMAYALEQGQRPRTDREMGIHAIEILDGIVASSHSGRFIKMESTFAVPELMPHNAATLLGGEVTA